MKYTAGIDLGTTNAAAAVYTEGMTRAVRLEGDHPASPSLVAPIGELGAWPVGRAAEGHEPLVARWFKRELGTGSPLYVEEKAFEPEDLLVAQLRWVLQRIEDRLVGRPTAVTLTHPATWRAHRTGLLETVAQRAGLDEISLLTEPLAAAGFYASQVSVAEGSVFAVFDLGGGTTDITVMRKEAQQFTELASSGSEEGSLDFDDCLVDLVEDRIGAGAPLDLEQLRSLAAQAKLRLSEREETTIVVPVGGTGLEVPLSREEFAEAIRPVAEAGVAHLTTALGRAGLSASELDTVLLAGSGSETPLVGELVAELMGRPPTRPRWPKMAVCFGAAIAAAASRDLLVGEQRMVRRASAPTTVGSEEQSADQGVPVDTRGLRRGPPLLDLSGVSGPSSDPTPSPTGGGRARRPPPIQPVTGPTRTTSASASIGPAPSLSSGGRSPAGAPTAGRASRPRPGGLAGSGLVPAARQLWERTARFFGQVSDRHVVAFTIVVVVLFVLLILFAR